MFLFEILGSYPPGQGGEVNLLVLKIREVLSKQA
jgi:hypothetical protein